LSEIYKSDQQDRKLLTELVQAGKAETDEFRKLVINIRKTDSLNLIVVSEILDKYGYLGYDDVGVIESQSLFLVIQHADLFVQEKYLPVIRKAVLDKKTFPSNLALLEDRISLRKGKKQIYGSQIWIDRKSGKNMFSHLRILIALM